MSWEYLLVKKFKWFKGDEAVDEKLILEFLSLRLDPGILTGAEVPNRPITKKDNVNIKVMYS